MPQQSKYALLDFNQLNENGLKPLVQAIEKSGFQIAKIIPAGTSRKKDGIAIKTFSLVAEDEQVMQVQVNDSGDISGLKLNGKTAPFQHASSLNDVAQSLARLFKTNASAFEKALARKLARAGSGEDADTDAPAKKTGVKSNAQILTEAKSRRDSAKSDINEATEKLKSTQDTVNKQKSHAELLAQQLAAEKALTQQLKEQVAKAQEGS